MTEKPDILTDIKDAARHLVRKWGPHDVQVHLSRVDQVKIDQYSKENPEVYQEPEGQSFTIEMKVVRGVPEGCFKVEIQKDDDEKDGGLIEI